MFVEKYLRELRKKKFSFEALYVYCVDVARYSREALSDNRSLARSTLTTGLGFFLVFFAASILLSVLAGRELANMFLLVTGLAIFVVFAWLLLHISLLRDNMDRPLVKFNAANVVSLLRLLLIPGLVIFIVEGQARLALYTYLFAAFSDVLDGMIARRFSQKTRLGLVLDPLVDIFFNSACFLALYFAGLVGWLVASLVLLRYLLLLCGATYIYVFRGPVRIRPTTFGKFSGLIVSVMVSLLLFSKSFLNGPPGDRIIAPLGIGLGLLAATNLVHVVVMGVNNLREKRLEEVRVRKVAG